MVLRVFKRVYMVYIGLFVRVLCSTRVQCVELEGQFSQLDGLDDQQQVNTTFQSDHEQANSAPVGHVIRLHGPLEQHQVNQSEDVDQPSSVLSPKNGTGRRKGSVLSMEDKRERKRLTDAKYRYNKRVESEKLKDENNRLRNMLQAALEQGKETAAPTIYLLQDLFSDTDLPVVVGEETAPRILEENQPLTYNPQADDVQRPFSVVPLDESQRTLPAVVQNDGWKSQEQNQLLTEPLQLFPACYSSFMEKLERDERSTVSYSDLNTLLQGETQEVGGYRIPMVLLPIYGKIVASYGDITSNCLLSPFSAENVLLQFLATVEEMQDALFAQVTEELIFRWRDCIAEAKRIKFNVDFAKEHLKKIANSYLGRKACNELSSIDKRIEVVKTELNDLQRERLKKYEKYPPQLLAASEDFPATVGLF